MPGFWRVMEMIIFSNMHSCVSKESDRNPVTFFPIIECEYLSDEVGSNLASVTSQLVPSVMSFNPFEFTKKALW